MAREVTFSPQHRVQITAQGLQVNKTLDGEVCFQIGKEATKLNPNDAIDLARTILDMFEVKHGVNARSLILPGS